MTNKPTKLEIFAFVVSLIAFVFSLTSYCMTTNTTISSTADLGIATTETVKKYDVSKFILVPNPNAEMDLAINESDLNIVFYNDTKTVTFGISPDGKLTIELEGYSGVEEAAQTFLDYLKTKNLCELCKEVKK